MTTTTGKGKLSLTVKSVSVQCLMESDSFSSTHLCIIRDEHNNILQKRIKFSEQIGTVGKFADRTDRVLLTVVPGDTLFVKVEAFKCYWDNTSDFVIRAAAYEENAPWLA